MLDIKTVGFIRIGKNLGELARGNESLYDPTMTKWANETRNALEAEPYPPRRAGQRYIRTYTLRNSWKTRRLKPGQHLIENTASQRGRAYPSFVVGTGHPRGRGQTKGHRQNNWWKFREKVEERLPELAANIAKDLAKVVNR